MFVKKLCALGFAVASFITIAAAQEKDLSAEQIIDRHLQSLGSAKEREKNRLRMAVGASEFTIHSGTGLRKAKGGALFASDGSNLALVSTFEMQDYRMERIGLFAEKISIPPTDAGRRSPLGNFLNAYDKLLSDHVLGGSIFSTWLLYNPTEDFERFRVEGKKRLKDRDVWVLNYSPRKGLSAGSSIKLYFDSKTFSHVRTVYSQKETDAGFYNTGEGRSAAMGGGGNRDWTNEMASNTHTLIEEFDDIRSIGGASLPHNYTIRLDIDSFKGSASFTWNFVINEYKLVKEFPAGTFRFQSGTERP